MWKQIEAFIYAPEDSRSGLNKANAVEYIDALVVRAFLQGEAEAQLTAHRILYIINMAHLSVSWRRPANHIDHPLIAGIKYRIEKAIEQSDKARVSEQLQLGFDVESFPQRIKQFVGSVTSDECHPLFPFLRDHASFTQMQSFYFQESPLEMLFGDILALMLPGVTGEVKMEFFNNYCDEMGRGNSEKVHRNLRAKLMAHFQLSPEGFRENYESLLCEELALVNLYMSLATNRNKHTQLVGVMLGTELVISSRFEYLIEGGKRLGADDDALAYLIEHTTVDDKHAEDWLDHVVMPILKDNPSAMSDIIFGVSRRLERSAAVLDRLYDILKIESVTRVAELALED